MPFFWKKKETIINKIKNLLLSVDKCRDLFINCMENLINEGPTPKNQEKAERVHDAESRIDDILREIEQDLYQHALIPESRGDVLGLLESFEKIPNMFESICFQMSLQRIEIPEKLKERFLRLIDVNIEAYNLVKVAVLGLFYKSDVHNQISKIDKKESESDRIERSLIREIFESIPIEKADKLLLKDITINIGNISDYAQATTDRLNLAIIKRRM